MAERFENNCFIVTRPTDEERATISVVKMGEYKDNRENKALYRKSFEKFFLNIEGRLPEVMHQGCLATVLPTLALLIHHELPENADQIREEFLENAPEELVKAYEEYPDQESSLYCAISFKLKQFLYSVETVGFAEAIKLHDKFYQTIHRVYFELPLIFISTIIDATHP